MATSNQPQTTDERPAYAWPGGYPLYYIVADGGTLCPTCANCKECKDVDKDCPDDDQWRIIGHEVNWEDPSLFCDNCNKRIESAYAEDEAEAKETTGD